MRYEVSRSKFGPKSSLLLESRYTDQKMEKLYLDLAEILEVDVVHPGQELEGFESWDSLVALSLVVSVRASYGVVITTEDLRRAKTVADLEQLIRSKQQAGKAN